MGIVAPHRLACEKAAIISLFFLDLFSSKHDGDVQIAKSSCNGGRARAAKLSAAEHGMIAKLVATGHERTESE
jgi:hypothetical protein